jgi:tight adherence protein B
MITILIILTLLLLLGGAGALAAAGAAMRAAQQIAKRRVNLVLAEPVVSAESGPVMPSRATGLVQSILGVGVRRSWDSETPPHTLVIAAFCGGALTWGLLFVVLRLPIWIWIPGTVLGLMIPPQILLRLEQGRLEARFVEAFPDAIDMIVRMLRAGLPMTAAIREVGIQASSPVKEVFASISDQMVIGVTFEHALLVAGKRVRSQDFRFFTVATSLQQATGGNLAVTLDILSEIIRKRRAGRQKAKAVTAEVRMSAYVLASMPFVMVAGLMVLNPRYLTPLITDPRGNLIVVMAVGGLGSGFLVMRQMMRSVTRL